MPRRLLLLTLCLAACASVPPTPPPLPTFASTALIPVAPSATPVLDASPTPDIAASPTPFVLSGEPLPHLAPGTPLTLIELQMHDAQVGWAIGQAAPNPNSDHILRTTDGGQTWQDVTPPQPFDNTTSNGLLALGTFADATTAWVTFADQNLRPNRTPALVWRTTDGGQSWAHSLPLAGADAEFYQPAHFTFPEAQQGWLLAHVGAGMMHDYVFIFHTTDRGATWQRVVDPFLDNLPMVCYKNGLTFTDAQNGWVVGDCGGVVPELYVYRTLDGGQTWNSAALPSPTNEEALFANHACGAEAITFFTPQIGRLVVFCDRADPAQARSWLYLTDDGGATWTSRALPQAVGTVMFTTPADAWYLGATSFNPAQVQYQLARTTDAGQTWQPLQILAWTSRLNWVDQQTGYAIAQAGANRAFVQTTDGGLAWTEILPIIAP